MQIKHAVLSATILLALWTTAGLPTQAWAIDGLLKLGRDELHCGEKPEIKLHEALFKALSRSDEDTRDLSEPGARRNLKLELVIHFADGNTTLPPDCEAPLLQVSEIVKSRKRGDLIIRASTGQSTGSQEMELAVASKRLDEVKRFLRNDRLARHALVLELHPLPSSELLGSSVETPRFVEIYSAPLN